MMRQSDFASLLPTTARRILGVVILQPERAWYRSELAKKLNAPASSLQRPLAALTAAGVLKTHRDGNRVYYQVDPQSPTYAEIRGLILKTSGLVEVLREALRTFAGDIRVAFVYGSFARGEEMGTSDVDLLVVGSIGLSKLALPLREASGRLGRELNATVYSQAEFEEKLSAQNHFILNVVDAPKLFVIGTEDDVARTPLSETGGRRARGAG